MNPRAKGTNFLGLLRALETVDGASARERVLDALPPELGEALRHGGIVSSGWYPVEWYAELHRTIDREIGGGVAHARALSAEAVAQDFRGIYRLLTLVLSPEGLLKRSPRAFGMYYDTGKLEIVEATAGRARIRFSGCAGFGSLLWADLEGGCLGVVRASGGKHALAHRIDGGGDSEETLLLDVRWE